MPMDDYANMEIDIERVRPHAEALAAKFDTVQIFVTRHDATTGGTVSVNLGEGNQYARRGQVREWLLMDEAVSQRDACSEGE